MSNLIIGIFEGEAQAEKTRRHLLSVERSTEVEDAVIMEKTRNGRIRFHHLTRETAIGALVGAFWGAMLGLLLLNPVFLLGGLVIGFFVGGIYGALSHVGVDADFVKTEAESMRPGDAALCVLTRNDATKLLDEFEKDGKTVRTLICTQTPGLKECCVHERLPAAAKS